jgi:hypothetical protein
MYILIGLASGLVFFLCLLSTYLMGLKHGKLLNNKIVPSINPATSLKRYVAERQAKKVVDEAQEGWFGKDGIMNYDPYKTKEGE